MLLSELKKQIEDFMAVWGDVDMQGEPSVQPYKPTSTSPIKAQIWDFSEDHDDAAEDDYDHDDWDSDDDYSDDDWDDDSDADGDDEDYEG